MLSEQFMNGAAAFVLLALLIYLSVTDIRTRRVPTEAVLAGACFFYMYIFAVWGKNGYPAARSSFISGVIGAVVLFLLTFAVAVISGTFLKENALGGGDIRLFSLIGLCLGLTRGLYILFLTCIFAVVFLLGSTLKNKKRQIANVRRLPLVPFMFAASAAVMLF